jgi:hypothetical protein
MQGGFFQKGEGARLVMESCPAPKLSNPRCLRLCTG